MSDLIDRDKLLEVLEERKKPNNGGEDGTKERYRYMQWLTDYNAVKEAPTAEPEIIACGDCKHWICHDRRCGYWNHGVKPLDWCCHAERRTDED